MRLTKRTAMIAGFLAIGGLAIAGPSARAQCGGGGARGGSWGGHSFALPHAPQRGEFGTGHLSLLSDGAPATLTLIPAALRSVSGAPPSVSS
jgi:hypothetical protein